MGYTVHKAIIVTSWNNDYIENAYIHALAFDLPVSNTVKHPVNDGSSFLIATSNSKSGWENAERHDANLIRWKNWVHSMGDSLRLEWCEVAYGNDPANAIITDHEWKQILE